MEGSYSYKNLQQTTKAVNVLQEFEQFINQRGASIEGDINIKVSEMGNAVATVKMFIPLDLLDECNAQNIQSKLYNP